MCAVKTGTGKISSELSVPPLPSEGPGHGAGEGLRLIQLLTQGRAGTREELCGPLPFPVASDTAPQCGLNARDQPVRQPGQAAEFSALVRLPNLSRPSFGTWAAV